MSDLVPNDPMRPSLYAGSASGRPGDAETTPGRCSNLDYCSIGMQRVLVQIPVEKPFICPECGGRLRPPRFSRGSQRPWVLPLARLIVLIICVGVALALGYAMGRVQPAVKAAAARVSKDASIQLETARGMIGLPPAEAPKPVLPAPAPPKPPAVVPLVPDRPYPAHVPPLDVADPPAHLVKEDHFGQVTIDCVLDAVLTKPVCHIGDIRGGDAFSAPALAWLRTLEVQYAPGKRGGVPVLLDHRWRVVFEDFSGTEPKAKAARP